MPDSFSLFEIGSRLVSLADFEFAIPLSQPAKQMDEQVCAQCLAVSSSDPSVLRTPGSLCARVWRCCHTGGNKRREACVCVCACVHMHIHGHI